MTRLGRVSSPLVQRDVKNLPALVVTAATGMVGGGSIG